jgi:hypothetical protein
MHLRNVGNICHIHNQDFLNFPCCVSSGAGARREATVGPGRNRLNEGCILHRRVDRQVRGGRWIGVVH